MKLTPYALALFCAATLFIASVAAEAAPQSKRGNDVLKKYCTGDYLAFCGNLNPDDPATDACFKTNWKKLSENCRRAIDAYAPGETPSRKRG